MRPLDGRPTDPYGAWHMQRLYAFATYFAWHSRAEGTR